MPLRNYLLLPALFISFFTIAQGDQRVSEIKKGIFATSEMQEESKFYLISDYSTNAHSFSGNVKKLTIVTADLRIQGPDSVIISRVSDSSVYTFDPNNNETGYQLYLSGNLYSQRNKNYDNGRLISAEETSLGGRQKVFYDYNYDKAGRMTEESMTTGKGLPLVKSFVNSQAGLLLKELTHSGKDTSSGIYYSYSKKGEKKGFVKYSFGRKLKSTAYEYDKQGRLHIMKDSVFLKNSDLGGENYADTIVRHHRFIYNTDNNIIAEEETGQYISWKRREMARKTPRTYFADTSEEKHEVSVDIVQEDARYEFYKTGSENIDTVNTRHTYDKFGSPARAERSYNKMNFITETRFEYDLKNNWISIRVFRDGKPVRQITRIFEYYK